MNEPKVIDLYEFLMESELQHYYNCIRNELKITTVAHLKYATDEDLKQIGLSRPEIRRMRKYFEKYYPHGYLSKIKRLLQNPRKDDANITTQTVVPETVKPPTSPSRIPNNKHIIPTDAICVNKQLGVGEFGIVQQGVWTNGTERIQVAIKCLCRERMLSNPMDFLKEAFIMHSIEHENIVRLYGVVLDTDSLMLVTELAPLRSLLECLKDSGLRVNFLTVPTLCEFAMQICNGMMYLENKRLIHRDLAARNVLVFSKNKVKISDFGLSKALGAGKDYYTIKFSPALKLPIAWCAPECINFLRFTSASDVFAFGVCLWEIFSYGFQPWAALTGQQILEAIDHPNCQRLEQPECCPKEYYTLMLKCWHHNPEKRPKFTEIYLMLPDSKPEQLKTIVSCNEPRKDHLLYRQGEIISVLDRSTNSAYWKGVLNSGKTGLFNPANTVAYLDSLPSSNNRDSFIRTLDRTSKRKLKTEMISRPQNDLKHTGHVGLDGAYFGDVSFLSNPQNYNHLPRQIVTPYKPSEDLEQTPLLLPPTPTSPDSTQTASGYFSESTNPSFVHTLETTSTSASTIVDNTKHEGFGSAFNFQIPSPTIFSGSNPFVNTDENTFHTTDYEYFPANKNFTSNLEENLQKDNKQNLKWPDNISEGPHEYHEISDDEIPAEKEFDLGPSLLDEMDFMFRSMSANSAQQPQSPDFDHTNKRNEITELYTKFQRKNSGDPCNSNNSSSSGNNKSKKKTGTVKLISVKDEKILNHAIEIANEISARSMTDLVSDTAQVAQSPKRKFSFKFPNLSSSHNLGEKDSSGTTSGNTSNSNTLTYSKERKNFSEELRNAPDLQNTITDQHRLAYNSLVEKSSGTLSKIDYIKKKTYEIDELKMQQKHTASLPRKSSTSTLKTTTTTIDDLGIMRRRSKEIDFNNVPTKQAPRPTTLPYNSSTLSMNGNKLSPQDNIIDTNPLRRLRDKNFPIIRPRLKTLPIVSNENINPITLDHNHHHHHSNIKDSNYLLNSEYSLSNENEEQQQLNNHHHHHHHHHNNLDNENVNEMDTINLQTTTIITEDSIKNIEKLENNGKDDNENKETINPIPLPPRDKKKLLITNPKRHIRKHPLIIPGNILQRTLNKVTQLSPTDDDINCEKSIKISNNNYNINTIKTFKLKDIDTQISLSPLPISVSTPSSSILLKDNNCYRKQFIENNYPNNDQHQQQRIYENLEMLQHQFYQHDNLDTASLNFEEILENNRSDSGCGDDDNVISPTLDVIDGCHVNCDDDDFNNYDLKTNGFHKFMNNKTTDLNTTTTGIGCNDGNNDELRKINIEKKKLEFSKRNPKYVQPKNELANNVLFNKIKDSVETTDTTIQGTGNNWKISTINNDNCKFQDRNNLSGEDDEFMVGNLLSTANDVSCEDLLEFSNDKPKGRERGVDSDEVRIMSKVLGKMVSPDKCLLALDVIDWDVHRAIKIYKLKDILNGGNLTMNECADALEKYDWDLQTTAIKLRKI